MSIYRNAIETLATVKGDRDMDSSFVIDRHTPIVIWENETVGVKKALNDLANDW